MKKQIRIVGASKGVGERVQQHRKSERHKEKERMCLSEEKMRT